MYAGMTNVAAQPLTGTNAIAADRVDSLSKFRHHSLCTNHVIMIHVTSQSQLLVYNNNNL